MQVTLKNRSDKSVSSDVTVTVYELGIFENGISSQTEVKVGEYTHKGVSVSENGTATFTIDESKLDNWSKNKCWSPDSPYYNGYYPPC